MQEPTEDIIIKFPSKGIRKTGQLLRLGQNYYAVFPLYDYADHVACKHFFFKWVLKEVTSDNTSSHTGLNMTDLIGLIRKSINHPNLSMADAVYGTLPVSQAISHTWNIFDALDPKDQELIHASLSLDHKPNEEEADRIKVICHNIQQALFEQARIAMQQ